MKEIIYQLEAVKTKCIFNDMRFDVQVLDGCINRLKAMETEHACTLDRLVDQNTLFGAKMQLLQDKLEQVEKERDAAIADLTEFAQFYKRRSVCDFCKHDRDSVAECRSHMNDNTFINNCFEWRGYNVQLNEV